MSFLKKLPRTRLLLPLILVAIVLVFLLARCASNDSETVETDPVTEGRFYLESLEAIGTSAVETRLKEIREEELQSKMDERLRQLESGEVSVWSLFEDYVIMGDSRTCGLIFDNYLDNSRILAAYGDTIRAIEDHIPEIEQLNPSYIFVCYGLNDVVQIGWETPEAYVKDYRAILDDLQARFPDAKIIVNSIFPCYEPAFSTRWEKWREVPEYSAAVGKMCEEAGYYFVENENIDDNMKEYWQEDGIHFISAFYPIWGTNMIMEVYESELRENEDTTA